MTSATASTSVVETTAAPSSCVASQRKAVIAERFKTKMCKNWERHGECPYEWRCMFAHGDAELRSKQRNLDDNLTTEDAIHEFQRAKRTAERVEAASREVEMPRPRSLVSGAAGARSANSTPPPPASPELSAHYRHHHQHHQYAMSAHLPHAPAAAVATHSRPATPVPTHEVRVPCGDHVHHHHGHSHSHDSDRWRRDPYAPRSPAAVHDLVTSSGLDSSSAMGSATFSFEHAVSSHSEVGTPRPSSVLLPAARTTSPPPPPVASLGSPALQRWSGGDATGAAAGDFDGPATPVPVSSWWWSSPSNETVGVMHDRTPSVRSDTTATSTAASEDAAARDALTAAAEDGTMVFVDGY